MSTTYKVLVGCDRQLGHDCHGVYELRGEGPRDFDNAGAVLFQQGWLRTFEYPDGAARRTPDKLVAVDTCPACAERLPQRPAEAG